MSSLAKEYVTQITQDELLSRNVIIGTDSEGRSSVLIRNTDGNGESACFENEFFIMKNGIVLEHDSNTIGNYHVLICKKKDAVSVEHFDRVCDYLFVKPDNSYSSAEMLKLFYSLETIFTVTSSRDRSLEIGLYGELSVINFFYDKRLGELYKTWHTDFFNKHDFEINKTKKLEVKSTVKDVRIHSFRHNQICREGLDIYVISCMLQPCENGLSLYDLCKRTISLLDNSEQMLAIELLMNKLGLNASYQGINCIQQETYDNMALFNAKNIPHIASAIPSGVSNVSYDVDFSGVDECDYSELI